MGIEERVEAFEQILAAEPPGLPVEKIGHTVTVLGDFDKAKEFVQLAAQVFIAQRQMDTPPSQIPLYE